MGRCEQLRSHTARLRNAHEGIRAQRAGHRQEWRSGQQALIAAHLELGQRGVGVAAVLAVAAEAVLAQVLIVILAREAPNLPRRPSTGQPHGADCAAATHRRVMPHALQLRPAVSAAANLRCAI